MAAKGATLAHSGSACLGYETPSKVEITPLDLPHKEVEPLHPVDEGPRELEKEVSLVLSCMYEKNSCKRHAKNRYP